MSKIQLEKVFKILENFEETKASDIDDLSGMFLKEDEKLLTTSINQLWNLPFPPEHFLMHGKKQSWSHLLKKPNLKNYHRFHFYHLHSKSYIYLHEQPNYLTNAKYCLSFNHDLEKTHSINVRLSYFTNDMSHGFDSGLLGGIV